jgi:hypothetical protein
MLEKAIQTRRYGRSTAVQSARFADDLVILIDAHRRWDWLVKAGNRWRREELAKLRVEINEEKSRMVDLKKGESFTFLGLEIRRVLSRNRKCDRTVRPSRRSEPGCSRNSGKSSEGMSASRWRKGLRKSIRFYGVG